MATATAIGRDTLDKDEERGPELLGQNHRG